MSKASQVEEVQHISKIVPTPSVPQNPLAPPLLNQNVPGTPFCNFLQFSNSPLVGEEGVPNIKGFSGYLYLQEKTKEDKVLLHCTRQYCEEVFFFSN